MSKRLERRLAKLKQDNMGSKIMLTINFPLPSNEQKMLTKFLFILKTAIDSPCL